jgi:hypothetical protein
MEYNENTKNIRRDFFELIDKYQLSDWAVTLEMFIMSLDYILEKEKEVTEIEIHSYIKRKKILKQLLWITKEDCLSPEKFWFWNRVERDNMDEIFKQLSRKLKHFWL